MGKALEIIKCKHTSKWIFIKQYLQEAFESRYSASALQFITNKFDNSIKMNHCETVNSYTDKIEQFFFYKLFNIYSADKKKGTKTTEHQLKEQTLDLYIKVLIKPINGYDNQK